MPTAVIIDALRTPLGKRNGALKDWHPVELGAHVLRELQKRNDLDAALVDDVITGCVSQVGEQTFNIGRNVVLAAGWPESVPATTVDRQCGSAQQAMHFAAQGVMAGVYDVAVALGVESMTRVPMGVSRGDQEPFSESIAERYAPGGGLVSQGIGAEMLCERWNLSREDLDSFSVESHRRAQQAVDEGRFGREIVTVPVGAEPGCQFDRDEGIRPESTLETLAGLRSAFRENGLVTAGNSSQISDGSAAVLIMSEGRANDLGYTPRARFHSFALAGADPVTMLTGPIPATRKILEKSGLSIDEIDLVEINEAFASVVLAWAREIGPDMTRVNPNGGAIAIGHPLGCSGTRLMTTLLHELERTGGRYGLQTMCEGGGHANVTIIERL